MTASEGSVCWGTQDIATTFTLTRWSMKKGEGLDDNDATRD
jgi:hypothetical protein